MCRINGERNTTEPVYSTESFSCRSVIISHVRSQREKRKEKNREKAETSWSDEVVQNFSSDLCF